MKFLSDQFVLDAYHDAVKYQLSEDFIQILLKEINLRNIGSQI